MFGVEVPNINIRGEKIVKTSAGACASVLVIIFTLIFALLKIEQLV